MINPLCAVPQSQWKIRSKDNHSSNYSAWTRLFLSSPAVYGLMTSTTAMNAKLKKINLEEAQDQAPRPLLLVLQLLLLDLLCSD
jgi:hypothetical protein